MWFSNCVPRAHAVFQRSPRCATYMTSKRAKILNKIVYSNHALIYTNVSSCYDDRQYFKRVKSLARAASQITYFHDASHRSVKMSVCAQHFSGYVSDRVRPWLSECSLLKRFTINSVRICLKMGNPSPGSFGTIVWIYIVTEKQDEMTLHTHTHTHIHKHIKNTMHKVCIFHRKYKFLSFLMI